MGVDAVLEVPRDVGRKDEGRRVMDEMVAVEVKRVRSVRNLDVYKLAFEMAMEIYKISESFPKEERYSLIDQIRRSSRAVCANLAECWRKRRYVALFINKLTDAAQEAAETQTWLEFALRCNYIDQHTFNKLDERYEHIFAMLFTMERKAKSFCR